VLPVEVNKVVKKEEEERKKERKKKPQGKNIMVCPIPQGDHN